MTGIVADIIDNVIEDVAEPVRVHIVGTDVERESSTQYASFQTYRLTGTETSPVRLLAQDLNRKRAVIQINNGFTDNNSAGYVTIGDVGSVSNGQGALLVSGNQVILENGRAVYLMVDGEHALTVTVIDERYEQK